MFANIDKLQKKNQPVVIGKIKQKLTEFFYFLVTIITK